MSKGIEGLTEVQRDNHYTVSQKIKTPNSCPQLRQLFTVRLSRKFVTVTFQTFFTEGLGSKFAASSSWNFPPRLKYVATLPCEIWMWEKWRQSELRIVINDRPQRSIARHLRCDELLYYTFITKSAGEKFFKIGEHLVKLQAKWLIISCAPSPCTFVLKNADLTR